MSLVRFSYVQNPVEVLKLKIRHAYDLHQLLCVDQFSYFFNSDRFAQMLLKVGSDDVISYKSNNTWLKNHPMEALIFKDPVLVWDKLKGVYENEFRAMVFGKSFPKADEILQTLKQIKDRLSVVDWTIMISEEMN